MPDRVARRGSTDRPTVATNADVGAAAASSDATPDAFLSYSRKDQERVLRIATALEEGGWTVWVDRDDVPPAAEWREELAAGIRAAHTFVFVVSPSSVASDYCRWELGEALGLGKRLIPVVIADADGVPPEVASRQYVFLRPSDDFDAGMKTLTGALATDLEWVREHRHWLLEALRWETQGRDRSLLIRGRDLRSAEAWFARRAERVEPRPTELQAEFLLASRAWETRRLRALVAAAGVALVVTAALGVLALLQRNEARDQAATARSRELAIAAESQLSIDPQRALLLAAEGVRVKATPEADNALRRALRDHRLVAEIPVRARRIGALVNAVAFSPDGRIVAAALKDGSITIAAPARRNSNVETVPAPPRDASNDCLVAAGAEQVALAFSSDGRALAAVNALGSIAVWDWPRPRAPQTSPFCLGRTRPPTALETAELLTGGGATRVQPVAIGFASARSVALVETDGDVVRWAWAGGRPAVERTPPDIVTAAFSADGRAVAIARDGSLEVRRPGSTTSVSAPVARAYAVAVSRDGGTVAAAAAGSLVVWRPGSTDELTRFTAPAAIRSVAVSGDGSLVAYGDSRNAIRVRSSSAGGEPVLLAGSQGPVSALGFDAAGARIVSGSDDGVLRVWELDRGRVPVLEAPSGATVRAQLDGSGELLAIDASAPSHAWLERDGRHLELAGVREPWHVSASADGRRIASVEDAIVSGAILLWEPVRRPEPARLTLRRGVNAVAVSPDGEYLAVAQRDVFTLFPWGATEGRVLARADGRHFTTIAFSRDGQQVAAARYDGKDSVVLVWSVAETLRAAHRLDVSGAVHDLVFDRAGERLAAGGGDGAVRVWELGDAEPLVLRGHEGNVNSVAFSADGRELASGGGDGTIRVWRLETAQGVGFRGPGGAIVELAFSEAGSNIVASNTTEARVWPCTVCGTTEDVLARAQRAATRELTAAERRVFLHQR